MKPKVIFPVLTVLLIMVIWGHSLMPAGLSSAESGFISDIIRSLFRLGDDAMIEHYVRKLAHFTEYAVLGIMIAIDTVLLAGKAVSPYSILTGIFTPFIDETIQLFSYGRSGEVLDIWLDFSGFVTGFICCGIILWMTKREKIKYKK